MKQFILDLANKAGHYLVSGVAITLLSVISVPIYTHIFPPTEMGYYYIVMSVAALVSIPMGLCMGNAVARFYYDHIERGEEFKEFISTYVWFGVLWGALVWLVFACLPRALWVKYLDPVYLPYVSISLVIGFVQSVLLLLTSIISVSLATKLLASVNVVNAVVIFALTLLLSLTFGLGIYGRMLAQVITGTLVVLFWLFHLYRTDRLSFSIRWDYLKQGFHFALPSLPEASMAWITSLSDRLLLVVFHLSAAVGTYAFGYDLSRMVMALLNESTFNAYSPMFYKGMTSNREQFTVKHNRFFTHYVLLMASLTLGLALFSHEIMRVIAPRSYAKSAPIIEIMAYACLVGSIYKPFVVALAYLKRTATLSGLSFVCAMTNLGLNIFLIPRFGGVGAAWATFAAIFVYTILAFIYSQRGLHIPYEYGRLSKILFINLFCMGVYVFVAKFHHLAYPIVLATKILCFLAYPFMLWQSGFFTRQEIRLIKSAKSLKGLQEAWLSPNAG